MEAWSYILVHIAAFIAGIGLSGYLAQAIWKNVKTIPLKPATSMHYIVLLGYFFIGIFLIGIAVIFGMWLDRVNPRDFSWVLVSWAAVMLVICAAAVCLNALNKMRKRTDVLGGKTRSPQGQGQATE